MSKIIEIHHHRDRALCLWRITMLQITKYITSTITHWFGMLSLAFNTMFSSQCKIVVQLLLQVQRPEKGKALVAKSE